MEARLVDPPRIHVIEGVQYSQLALDALPDLCELAHDLAAWSETVDGPLDYADYEDLEELGRRAHEIVQRLRPPGNDGGCSARRDQELDCQLEGLDRHAA